MKSRRSISFVLAAALLLPAALWAVSPGSRTAAAAARAEQQSADIVKRIDGLLKQRIKPEPLPHVLPNPFVVVNGVVTAPRSEEAAPETTVETKVEKAGDTTAAAKTEEFPAFTNAEILARCAQTLKFAGMLQVNGRVQLVINNVPRKEGDIVTVALGNNVVYLRVAKILPGAVTMRLNDAEQVLPF